MAVFEPLDLAFRMKFDAAIQDHIAKKATNKRVKIEAREKARYLREQARVLEANVAAGNITDSESLPAN